MVFLYNGYLLVFAYSENYSEKDSFITPLKKGPEKYVFLFRKWENLKFQHKEKKMTRIIVILTILFGAYYAKVDM